MAWFTKSSLGLVDRHGPISSPGHALCKVDGAQAPGPPAPHGLCLRLIDPSQVVLLTHCLLRHADNRARSFTVTMTSGAQENPFEDPSYAGNQTTSHAAADVPATLAVGRNASLTLGTDSLIVLGTCALVWKGHAR